jgi:hypothetical protein
MSEETVKAESPIKIETPVAAPEILYSPSITKKKTGSPVLIMLFLVLILVVGGYLAYQQSVGSKKDESKISVGENGAGSEETDSQLTESDKSAATGVDEISLSVTYPSRDITVDTEIVTVSGVTEPEAEVSVNDKEIVADSDGKFSVKLTLVDGENYVTVVAVNSEGKTAEIERIVTYEPKEDL